MENEPPPPPTQAIANANHHAVRGHGNNNDVSSDSMVSLISGLSDSVSNVKKEPLEIPPYLNRN